MSNMSANPIARTMPTMVSTATTPSLWVILSFISGEKFNHKYAVVQKLGWGHFSTVWLVQNETNQEYSALKIQRSKENHAESALD